MYQYYPHELGFIDVQFRDGTWNLFDPDQDDDFRVDVFDSADNFRRCLKLTTNPPIIRISVGKFKVEGVILNAPAAPYAYGVAYYRWYAKKDGTPINMYPVFEYCFEVLEPTPDTWLCTLPDLRTYLQIPDADTAQDPHLQNLILRATAFIQRITRRTLLETVHTDYISGDGTRTLLLGNYPLTAVTLIEDNLSGNADFSFTDSDLNEDFGFEEDGELMLLSGDVFNSPSSAYPPRNYKVTYTAGFPTAPEELRQICVELAAAKYYLGEKQRLGIATKTFGGETVTYRADDLSPAQRLVLDQYTRPVIGRGV